MARSRNTVDRREADELADVEGFYRRRLTAPAELPKLKWEPVRIGPTWQIEDGRWVLPERTLGWQVLAWSGLRLHASRDEPWVLTDEQARFILWWYAVDESGAFLKTDGVLQRLKGWGKDPIGATIGLAEMVGPVRVVDIVAGQPVGGPHPDAWVQTAAVSIEQTKNTMRLLPGLLGAKTREVYNFAVGKESAYALGGTRFFQAVTSSPATLEGGRATFVLLNETHHWNSSNGGHEMSAVIERNATKSADGAARTLRITNAYEPGLDSVAERDREAYESVEAGQSADAGLLYDSLEAPPEAPLSLEEAPDVVRAIRGDSTWLNIDRIVKSIADKRNPPSRSRRFWYNQITAAEDAWLDPLDVDAIKTPGCLADNEPVFLFFDGSKSDDATALVACRLSDGRVFQVGVWQRPPGWDPRVSGPWTVNRDDVDLTVENTFLRLKVLGFWADPSHARDDEDERYWDTLIDTWHGRHKRKLKLWAAKTGDRQHSIMWDMSAPSKQAEFTQAAERFVLDVKESADAKRAGQPLGLTIDGSGALVTHLKNARERPNKYGKTLGKEHRESRKKIDLAVCAVGARMMRRMWQNKGLGTGGNSRVIAMD